MSEASSEMAESSANLLPPPIKKRSRSMGVVVALSVLVFALVFALSILTSVVIIFRQPRIYQSSVVIKVEQERPRVTTFEVAESAGIDPYFLQTQFAIIQSQKILQQVIERLRLQDRWAQNGQRLALEVAYRKLRSQLALRRYRETNLIEMVVRDTGPAEAAEIANVIAEAYRDDRLNVVRQQVTKGLNKLVEEMEKQHQRGETARQKVEQLGRDLNIPVPSAVELNDMTTQLAQQLTKAKAEVAPAEARWEKLQNLTPQELRDAVTSILSTPSDLMLQQEFSNSELRREMLQLHFSADDPHVKSAIAERDKLREQLDARLAAIQRSVQVEYRIAQARVTELQKQLDRLSSPAFLPYRDAQREVEMEQKLFDAIKTRVQQASIELQVPQSPVEIINRAMPAHIPLMPNITSGLMRGILTGLPLGLLLSLLTAFGLSRK